MNMLHRFFVGSLVILSLVHSSFAEHYTIVTVDKTQNSAQFERLQEGLTRFSEETGHHISLYAPAEADPVLQAQIIEDTITQPIDALCVIPVASAALEPVLKKTIEQEIIVISYNARDLQHTHYNLESFENAAFGAHLMEQLARSMQETGEYAIFVESTTHTTQNEWVDAAIALQKERYPNMHLVTRRLEMYGDSTIAYNKTRELLKAYPQLKGIQASLPSAIQGAALAVKEHETQHPVMVIGTNFLPEVETYLKDTGLRLLSFWDPAHAGYAMNMLAVMLLEGETIAEGANLGVPGYKKLVMHGNTLYGSAWIDITQDTGFIDD